MITTRGVGLPISHSLFSVFGFIAGIVNYYPDHGVVMSKELLFKRGKWGFNMQALSDF